MNFCWRWLFCCCICCYEKKQVEPKEVNLEDDRDENGKMCVMTELQANENSCFKKRSRKKNPEATISPSNRRNEVSNSSNDLLYAKVIAEIKPGLSEKEKNPEYVDENIVNKKAEPHIKSEINPNLLEIERNPEFVDEIAANNEAESNLGKSKTTPKGNLKILEEHSIELKASNKNKATPHITRLNLVENNNKELKSEIEKFQKKTEELVEQITAKTKKNQQESSKSTKKNEKTLKKIESESETYQAYKQFESQSQYLNSLKLKKSAQEIENLRLKQEIDEPLPLDIFKNHLLEQQKMNEERQAKVNRIKLL